MKKNIMKKAISFIVVFTLIISMFSITAFAYAERSVITPKLQNVLDKMDDTDKVEVTMNVVGEYVDNDECYRLASEETGVPLYIKGEKVKRTDEDDLKLYQAYLRIVTQRSVKSYMDVLYSVGITEDEMCHYGYTTFHTPIPVSFLLTKEKILAIDSIPFKQFCEVTEIELYAEYKEKADEEVKQNIKEQLKDYPDSANFFDNDPDYKEFVEKDTELSEIIKEILGDADDDGEVTIIDATCVQKFKAELIKEDEISMTKADIDKDGAVTVIDATCIQKTLASVE